MTWGCSQTLSHDLQTRQWCWAPEDPPPHPQAGSLEGWNPSLQPDCGVGAEARAQPKRQQTTGQMGQPCARHRGVPLRPPLSSVLAWDAPFLRPFHSHPQGTSRVPPPRPALQGCPCLHCPSGCSGLYPSRRPLHLGPSRAGVCVFPCLRPGSVHVLFSPSGQAAGGAGGRAGLSFLLLTFLPRDFRGREARALLSPPQSEMLRNGGGAEGNDLLPCKLRDWQVSHVHTHQFC